VISWRRFQRSRHFPDNAQACQEQGDAPLLGDPRGNLVVHATATFSMIGEGPKVK
jgi:hypothetical protein